MLTPSFTCSQNNTSVIVFLYVPAIRASDAEIHVEDTVLTVHINPYFLRLTFSGRILEDDASNARYDPSSGHLNITVTKETPGEHFKDLDILANLLAPPKSLRGVDNQPVGPIIEVLSTSVNEETGTDDDLIQAAETLSFEEKEILKAAENDWELPQTLPESPSVLQTSIERRYGFLDMYTGYFRHVAHTENEVNELRSDAETLLGPERRKRRLEHENEKWDEEYYMADYADDENIQDLIEYQLQHEDTTTFSGEENMTMLRLPQKEYLATPQQTHNTYLALLAILFSYAYDARTTQQEPTSESAWTICSLTPMFSALDPPPYDLSSYLPPSNDPASISHLNFSQNELQTTLIPSIRRSLAFPLYRSIILAETCINDVSCLLHGGRRAILRALLTTKRILDNHDIYYVYSKIWVDDLCGWVARDASDEVLKSLGDGLKNFRADKGKIGWDILALESAVDSQTDRERDSDDE